MLVFFPPNLARPSSSWPRNDLTCFNKGEFAEAYVSEDVMWMKKEKLHDPKKDPLFFPPLWSFAGSSPFFLHPEEEESNLFVLPSCANYSLPNVRWLLISYLRSIWAWYFRVVHRTRTKLIPGIARRQSRRTEIDFSDWVVSPMTVIRRGNTIEN